MSAGHIDWFDKNGVKFSAILDDASRKILVAGEFESANTANSIALVDRLVEDCWDIMPLEELISDRNEFGAHRRNGKKEWESRFKRHLDSLGIKLITTRVRHPQTNGKIEKLFPIKICNLVAFYVASTPSPAHPKTRSPHIRTIR